MVYIAVVLSRSGFWPVLPPSPEPDLVGLHGPRLVTRPNSGSRPVFPSSGSQKPKPTILGSSRTASRTGPAILFGGVKNRCKNRLIRFLRE
jgi:hypothetical protein